MGHLLERDAIVNHAIITAFFRGATFTPARERSAIWTLEDLPLVVIVTAARSVTTALHAQARVRGGDAVTAARGASPRIELTLGRHFRTHHFPRLCFLTLTLMSLSGLAKSTATVSRSSRRSGSSILR